jgi:hypothetical protein
MEQERIPCLVMGERGEGGKKEEAGSGQASRAPRLGLRTTGNKSLARDQGKFQSPRKARVQAGREGTDKTRSLAAEG